MINANPIFNNVYERKNITVTFKDDFSTAWISNGQTEILVDCALFKDVFDVMNNAVSDDTMQWNIMGTSLSKPYDKDEFSELLDDFE